MFWSVWEGEKFYNASAVDTLVNDWDVTVVRAAMTANTSGLGYVNNADAEKRKVKAIVDAAIARGIYVLIDWHDHDATPEQGGPRSASSGRWRSSTAMSPP